MTQQIIRIAQEYAQKNNAYRVTEINLVVGDHSEYLAECIRMYFDIIAEETCCAGAVLNIQRIVPKLRCQSCGSMFERKPFSFACPDCGGEGVPTETGREFYVESIVVQQE